LKQEREKAYNKKTLSKKASKTWSWSERWSERKWKTWSTKFKVQVITKKNRKYAGSKKIERAKNEVETEK